MLKTKVTCWFCNKTSQVFILNRNSWTCQHCEQYNGFNKDGDYNKVIPEMSAEVQNKKYCQTSNANGSSGQNGHSHQNSILCDRCNQNQELKLAEMKKFEANFNDKNEEEYSLYVKKLDHIYDLCRPCKTKLSNHLRQIDSQIGDTLLRQRNSHVTSTITSRAALKNGPSTTTTKTSTVMISSVNHNGIEKSSNLNSNNFSKMFDLNDLCDNLKSSFRKAYTVAGTSDSPKPIIRQHKATNSPNKRGDISPATKKERKTREKTSSSITCASVMMVLEDFFIYTCLLLVFACDLVNLLNDSGVLLNNANTNREWFQTLLGLYKHVIFIMVVIIGCSLHLAFKRPKISRFLMIIGFFFSFIVHVNFFDFTNEEQYIIEALLSFFLLSYLSIARVYNLFQLVRFIGVF